jgi:hypothetical protein
MQYSKIQHLGKVKGTISETKSLVCSDMKLTKWFMQDCAKGWMYIVATFGDHLPLISGFGSTKEQALTVSSNNNPTYIGELCERTTDTIPTWKSESGKIVTINDIY